MHQSAFQHMQRCVARYMPKNERQIVVDVGSRVVGQQVMQHRNLLKEHLVDYIGIDVAPGENVDLVMENPYSFPVDDDIADVVLSGQVFEHVPFFWVTFLEMARILKPGGYIFLTAPSRGHLHHPPYDCWRFYSDGYRALAAFANLHLVEAHTDYPGKLPNGRFDYAGVPANIYWGDTVGVFQKTAAYDKKVMATMRDPLVAWANVAGALGTPLPQPAGPQKATVQHGAFDVSFGYRPNIITPKVKASIEAGRYEAREAKAALKYLGTGERVLELGAGLGFISTIVKREKAPANYIAVEGDPRLIPAILENLKLNNVSGVDLRNCIATSNPVDLEKGYTEFRVSKDFWGSSATRKDISDENAVKVNVVSFGSIIAESKPTAIIADIEGGEAHLFDGVDMPSVNTVIIEMHPVFIGEEEVNRVFEELNRCGLTQKEYGNDGKIGVAVFTREA